MLVLLDTNALMIPEQFGVDIFSELERLGYREFLVPSPVVDELKVLAASAKKKRDRLAASIGLILAERCKIVEINGEADLALEKLALEENAAVLTGDRELKKRLSTKGTTVIHLRQRQYLEIWRQKES